MVAGNKKKISGKLQRLGAAKRVLQSRVIVNDATLNVETFQVFAYSFHVYKASTYEYEAGSFLTR